MSPSQCLQQNRETEKFKINSYTSVAIIHQPMQCLVEASNDKPQNNVEEGSNCDSFASEECAEFL